MRDHVRILAYLRIVLGSIGLVAALAVLFVFGGIAAIVGAANPHDMDAQRIAIPILGMIGIAVSTLVLLISVPGVIAGVGLLKFRPWARILAIVLSALDLPMVPIGTALGVYGLWVLLQPQTERLFAEPATAQAR